MYSTCIGCSTDYILNDHKSLFHEIFLTSPNVLSWTFTPYQMVKCKALPLSAYGLGKIVNMDRARVICHLPKCTQHVSGAQPTTLPAYRSMLGRNTQYGSGSGHPPPSKMCSTCIGCSTDYILNDHKSLS
jgi:hypothetical protein